MSYDLFASAYHHPNSEQPHKGLFNRRSLQSLARHDACSVTVSAPVPTAPPLGPFSFYRSIAARETFGEYRVLHPRFLYLLPKSLLYGLTGRLFRRVTGRVIADRDMDVLHGNHVYPDGYGLARSAVDRDLPLTVICHGHFLNNLDNLPPFVASQVASTLASADHVCCVSNALEVKARDLAPDTPISTVPIGASPTSFPTSARDCLREKYEIGRDDIIVLFCGQFVERKGIGDVIESIEDFPTDDVEYVFVGHGGNLRDELETAASRGPWSDSVRIYENLPTTYLREWYAMADLLLLPSYAEGRPTVIYEAMAAETAVLSTTIDGVVEQVVDGNTGVLIEPGDSEGLVAALEQLVSRPDRLRRMGKRGKERLISKGWTWANHADRIVEIHHGLI